MSTAPARLRSCLAGPLVLLAAPALAQSLQMPVVPPAASAPPAPVDDQEVTFAADTLDYDDKADIVTATGSVRMLRNGNRLRADEVVWNRTTGEVRAIGHVAITNPGGDTAYGDNLTLTDSLKDGVADNMLLVLSDGGRIAARHGVRQGQRTTLTQAAYTPCAVTAHDGCPKEPTWKITAVRVIHDQDKHRIFYKDARFNFLGRPVFYLPAFSHPDGEDKQAGGWGLLVPQAQYIKRNGLEVDLPYYLRLSPNRDLTITPHLYTGVEPMLEAQYRQLTGTGAYQIHAYATYANRLTGDVNTGTLDNENDFRGYIDAYGRFQYGPYWTLTGQLRVTSDDTFLRRYNFSYEDRLRSFVQAERIDNDSYLSIEAWATETLRVGDSQKMQPAALPAVDYRRRWTDPVLGGIIQLQLNSLSLVRAEGQDTQRAFAGLRWDLKRYTPLGQEVTFTAYSQFDVYHTDNVNETPTVIYRGDAGWTKRAIGALAVDMRWPFVGQFLGGTQQIVPRVQFVATPHTANLSIPNEDARSLDLEDTNLFALNRFAGYDRWQDASRVTYGGEWNVNLPRFAGSATLGQSYQFTDPRAILPDGTGLSGHFSDFVGRFSVKYGRFFELTDRFRLDKDDLAIRRNEVDATIGSSRTYLMVGYLRLNRHIDTSIEDLRDHEELRAGFRIAFARFWSIFGSTVIDLTDKKEDPTSITDGFSPVRHRLGIQYEDNCIQLGVSWRKDFDPTRDVAAGSVVALRLALKNLGR